MNSCWYQFRYIKIDPSIDIESNANTEADTAIDTTLRINLKVSFYFWESLLIGRTAIIFNLDVGLVHCTIIIIIIINKVNTNFPTHNKSCASKYVRHQTMCFVYYYQQTMLQFVMSLYERGIWGSKRLRNFLKMT